MSKSDFVAGPETNGLPDLTEKPVVIFDGVCNFCNRSIPFIVKRDPDQQFMFAPSQGKAGQRLLEKFNLSETAAKTVVLISGDNAFIRSDAAFKILSRLRTAWKFLLILRIVPRPIRDAVYHFFATNRYRFFGKLDSCIRPSQELRNRFLD